MARGDVSVIFDRESAVPGTKALCWHEFAARNLATMIAFLPPLLLSSHQQTPSGGAPSVWGSHLACNGLTSSGCQVGLCSSTWSAANVAQNINGNTNLCACKQACSTMGTDCAAFSFSDQQATSDGTHCKLCTLGFSTETSSALSRLYRTYRGPQPIAACTGPPWSTTYPPPPPQIPLPAEGGDGFVDLGPNTACTDGTDARSELR